MGTVWVELVIFMIEAIPLIYLFLACLHWSSYATSRLSLMMAGFAAFACPMLVSLFQIQI